MQEASKDYNGMKLALTHTRVRFQHLKIAGNIDTIFFLKKLRRGAALTTTIIQEIITRPLKEHSKNKCHKILQEISYCRLRASFLVEDQHAVLKHKDKILL